MKTAIVIGSTGLVGSNLIDLLLENEEYSRVKIFTRRPSGINHPKLNEFIVNFDQLHQWQNDLKGDVLYSALGTTLKKAGNKDAQYMVDYTYQYSAAKAAANNGVKYFGLVSAIGADPKSLIFYNRMKGELDRDVTKLPFEKIIIVRPSGLLGERKENRPMEKIGIGTSKALKYIPYFNKYRPIHAKTVARSLINAIENPDLKGVHIFNSNELFNLASP
ncbi:MAG: NAD(P)H-binding protein [Bacteroidota bacterium]